jgi:thiol-disulfide isomerase/thioredoxin
MALFGKEDLSGIMAPEFPEDLVWLNSGPLKMKELLAEGKIILVDFWTYSCINCIRTLPHLTDWDEKYRKDGLAIVGVHTPEFDFEKEKENVEKALSDFNIKYPVVMDSDYKIWNLYSNHFWPRKLIVGTDGKIAYDHAGEGGYAETESAIQKLLKLEDATGEISEEGSGGICYPMTPELYLGYERGVLGNKQGFQYDSAANYVIEKAGDRDRFYLRGSWLAKKEYIEHAVQTNEFVDFIQLNFSGLSVNIVLSSKDKKPYEILVTFEDKPMESGIAGHDIIIKDGQSMLKVEKDKMYNLISSPEYLENKKLKLFIKSDNCRAFAFTFGGCTE